MVLREIDKQTSNGVSPVSGRKFKGLTSKTYKNLKRALVGNTNADLHLSDSMISSITHRPTKQGIMIEINKSSEVGKSHNHNTKKTKKSTSPLRQFIPNDKVKKGVGGNFNKDITKKVNNILKGINNASKDNN